MEMSPELTSVLAEVGDSPACPKFTNDLQDKLAEFRALSEDRLAVARTLLDVLGRGRKAGGAPRGWIEELERIDSDLSLGDLLLGDFSECFGKVSEKWAKKAEKPRQKTWSAGGTR